MTTEYSSELTATGPAQARGAGAFGRTVSFKRLFLERWPLMAAVSAALAIPLCAGSWLLITPEYEAGATLRFLRNKQSVLFDSNNSLSRSTDYEQHVMTEAGLITGPVMNRILDEPAIRDHPYIAKQDDPLLFLQRELTAQLRPNQELVDITFRAPDRDLALAVVTTTVQKYQELAASTDSKRGGDRRISLSQERDRVREELDALRARIAQRRESLGSIRANVAEEAGARIEALHAKLAGAQDERITSELESRRKSEEAERLEALEASYRENPTQQIFEYGIEGHVEADALAISTAELVAIEEKALAIAEETYQPGAPQLKVQRERRDSVYGKLQDAKSQARRTALGTALERAKADRDAASRLASDAQEREKAFREELDTVQQHALEMVQAQNQISEWEREAANLQEFLNATVSAITTIDVESNAPASVEVAAEPYVPSRPAHGRQIQAAAALLVLSVGAGLAAGFMREISDQQIRSPQDLSHITQLPLLAVVPHTRYDRLPNDVNTATLMATHPDSTSADEYRRILSRIVYPPEGAAELNSCLITGASRADGKTTVACNLAMALALANRRVLLIDICARRPSVERNVGLQSGIGLAEIFANQATLSTCVRPAGIPGLDVLGPGTAKNLIVGQYASRELVQLLEEAEQTYDHVIIDSPPALLMADAGLLAPVVDGVILVAGSGVSTQGMVRRCIQELNQAGAHLIGVVLNRMKPVPGGYMERNLNSYYHYGRDESDYGRPADLARKSSSDREAAPTLLLIDESGGGAVTDPPFAPRI